MRGRASRGRKSPPSTVAIPVQATSAGAISADQFTGWTHTAGAVFSRTAYGATAKYFDPNSGDTVAAQTKSVSRDHEVTFWTSLGRVYIRMVDGKAFRFTTNINSGGGWSVAFVSVGSSGFESDTTIADLGSGTPSGIDTGDTDGDQYTFGVSGFDIYVKWNGVEQWREKQILLHKPGRVGLRGVGTMNEYGFREVSVEFKASAALFSSPEFNILDVRDFDVKALTAVGSMTAASTTLTVASDPGFAIGDQIIVEIGGEAGAGARGTRGVGGQWPNLTYANATAMNADTGQVTNKLCALVDTGVVYQWNGSAWGVYATEGHFDLMLPRALITTITNISGTTFTVADAATVSTTNTNVYYNAAAKYEEVLGAGDVSASYISDKTIEWPAGNFAWGAYGTAVHLGLDRLRWNVRGQGVDETTIFSPDGTLSLDLSQSGWVGPSVCHDIKFGGNYLASGGYHMFYDGTTDVPEQGFPVNLRFNTGTDVDVYNVRATNWNQSGVVLSYCTDCTTDDIEITHATGHRAYTQWGLNFANSENCSATNVTIDSDYFTAGFEQFQCTNCTFTNITGRNTFCAMNSSGDWRYIGLDITLETGAADASYLTWASSSSPVVNINSNIDNQQGVEGYTDGGVLENFHLVQQDDFRSGVVFTMVSIDGTGDNVTIRGQFPDKPNNLGLIELPTYSSGLSKGVKDDNSTRTILIDGVRVIGTNSGGPDIGVASSNATVTNCVAETITTPGATSGNITNAAYNAL